MLHKTSGIILHTTNFSESSLIVKVYTDSFGIQSYIINGVRGKKSKNKASLFQPMAIVNLIVSKSERATLQRISEISIQHPYSEIPYNIVKSSLTIFLNEVLFRSLKEQHADEDIFEFIKNSLLILDLKSESCANFHLLFLVQFSRFLGFYPQGFYSADSSIFDLQEGRFVNKMPLHRHYLDAHMSELFFAIIQSSYELSHTLKINKSERKELLQSLIVFYQCHVSSFGEIKSLEVLEEVIS